MCFISPLFAESLSVEVLFTVDLLATSLSWVDGLRFNVFDFFKLVFYEDCTPELSSNAAEILSIISG